MSADGHAAYVNEQYETGAVQAKAASDKQERMAKVIADLLASAELAAKRGDENETNRLLAQASALQLKFAVDDAMLAKTGGKAEEVIYQDFCQEQNTPLIKAKRQLINCLANRNRGHAILCGAYRKDANGQAVLRSGKMVYDKRAYVRVFAHESDLRFISQLYTSLILQMQSFMARDERSATGKTISAWRVSYAYGYVERINARLLEAERAATREAEASTPGTALVLRDRSQLVDAHIDSLYGKLKTTRHRKDDNDPAGKAAGRQAGDRADLGGKKVSSSSTRRIAAKRCEALARKGTGTGTCGRSLDESGQCDRASSHIIEA